MLDRSQKHGITLWNTPSGETFSPNSRLEFPKGDKWRRKSIRANMDFSQNKTKRKVKICMVLHERHLLGNNFPVKENGKGPITPSI